MRQLLKSVMESPDVTPRPSTIAPSKRDSTISIARQRNDDDSDLLRAFEPYHNIPHLGHRRFSSYGEQPTGPVDEDHHGYRMAEALHTHHVRSTLLARRYIARSRRSSSFLHRPTSPPRGSADPVSFAFSVPDTEDIVSRAREYVDALEQEWKSVRSTIEVLAGSVKSLSQDVTALNELAQQVGAQVESSYPELMRNIDLARQLSATSQTSLPYISTLPPWAREILGPFIEYTLELIGMAIRWILYPLWQLLPSPLKWLLGFITIVLGSTLILAASAFLKFLRMSVAFGVWLSTWSWIRAATLGVSWVITRTASLARTHWVLALAVMLTGIVWLTGPTDIEDGVQEDFVAL